MASIGFVEAEFKDRLIQTIRNSTEWLISSRNKENLWGRLENKKTGWVQSAHALIALLDAEALELLPDECLKSLRESTDSYLSHVNKHKDDIRGSLIAYEHVKAGIRTYHYDLPWVITAMSRILTWVDVENNPKNSGNATKIYKEEGVTRSKSKFSRENNKGLMNPSAGPLLEMVDRLLCQQKEGAFVPIGHQSKPIWATHDSVYALDTFRRSFTIQDILDVLKRKDNLKGWIKCWVIISLSSFIPLTLIILCKWQQIIELGAQNLIIAYLALVCLAYIYALYKVRILETRSPSLIFKKFLRNFIRTLEERLLGKNE